jgi:4-amino-4-deoxy-L-arabinose transferase-like glycosyltransferase
MQRTRISFIIPGLGLAIFYVVILILTCKGLGFARDEGFYFRAGELYLGWFKRLIDAPQEAFTSEVIRQHFEYNSEHPALMKMLFGLSWELFSNLLGVVRPSLGFRLPAILMAGLLVFLIYLFGAKLYGKRAGFFASLIYIFMPRPFYHAHLNCFDVPVTTFWFLTIYAYWRSLNSIRWGILVGVFWGIALSIKLNAFFIPLVLLIHYFCISWRRWQASFQAGEIKFKGFSIPLAFLSMLVLGPLIFIALWPWLWFFTFERIQAYLSFHLHHPYYNMAYFGYNYFRPPFPISFPFVMSFITVPFTSILLCFLGIGIFIKERIKEKARESRGTNLLMGLNLFIPFVIIALPFVPIFGGTKHWLQAMPYLALISGVGFSWIMDKAKDLGGRLVIRRILSGCISIFLLFPSILETWASHPFGLCHYTVIGGGVPGAANLGMNRQFWGYTTGSLVDWFNKNVPPGGRVFFHDTAYDSYRMLQRDGDLRSDIHAVGSPEEADVAIIHHELHMREVENRIISAFGTTSPVYVLTHFGVPIISVYKR